MTIPRLRMFAGPNGSGKTTIKNNVPPSLIGHYVNPDEIEQQIKECKYLNFQKYGISAESHEIQKFFYESALLKKFDLTDKAKLLKFLENKILFDDVEVNSYFASVCADFIRHKLLAGGKSFTFETVMSSVDKIDILKRAQLLGYRTYLYYVSTSDPIININRVENRVSSGGHDVPEDKIRDRYFRSMNNLSEAIKYTNRAYIFDNSFGGGERILIAEITDSENIDIKSTSIPAWCDQYIFNKFEIVPSH